MQTSPAASLGTKAVRSPPIASLAGATVFAVVYFSQFYIFPSGVPQPAHWVASVMMLFGLLTLRIRSSDDLKAILLCFVFTLYVSVIDSVYGGVEANADFVVAALYQWFNFFLLVALISLNNKIAGTPAAVRAGFFWGILSLLAFLALGFGEAGFGARFVAFFNDPNQLAFWTLCGLSSFFLLTDRRPVAQPLILLAGIAIIVSAASRSALLGLSVTSLGAIATIFASLDKRTRRRSRVVLAVTALASVLLAILVARSVPVMDSARFVAARFETMNVAGQAEARGYTRLVDYPEYLLFGAGQAMDDRFRSKSEVHSTWAAILFYYGAIGLALFGLFLLLIFRRLTLVQTLIGAGPLIYGFTTYGARSPVFWLFLFSVYACGHRKKQGEPMGPGTAPAPPSQRAGFR